MGQLSTSFIVNEGKAVNKYTKPDKANWITAHAIASELSIAEVERLWMRFQQLGCDSEGVITEDMLKASPVQNDVFMRNIMRKFMSAPTRKISFENFIRSLKFFEEADTDTKLKGIFALLNNGNPVHKDLLTKIFERVYEDQGDDVKKLADTFFTQMDTDNKGQITEAKFLQSVKRIPTQVLEELLDFHILSNSMKEKLHRRVPEFRSAGSQGESPSLQPKKIPTDAKLKQIAAKIQLRDWDRVANKLGILTEDITKLRQTYRSSKVEQVYQMLLKWKNQDGDQDILDKALRASGMTDAAQLLNK